MNTVPGEDSQAASTSSLGEHQKTSNMPDVVELMQRFKCTYKDCNLLFDTEKVMKNYKKYSDEHQYCVEVR